MELTEIDASMQEMASVLAEGFDAPDDDWPPLMNVVSGDGTEFAFGFDPAFMENDETKDRLVEVVIKPAITGCGAKQVGLMMSSWAVVLDLEEGEDPRMPDGTIKGPRPSEHPERVEMLTLTTFSPTEQHTQCAKIVRHDDAPPTLEEWQAWGENDTIEGRFVDGLQDALRDSSGRPMPSFLELLEQAKD